MNQFVSIILMAIFYSCSPAVPRNDALISFINDKHDFGNLSFKKEAEYCFQFTNPGKTPIVIFDVKTSWGCTVPDWSKKPIKPASKGEIKIKYEFMKNNVDKININLKQFWISQGGKEDIAWQNCQIMLKKFDEMKIKYTYSEYPGGHSWTVWRNNLYNFAQLLFK